MKNTTTPTTVQQPATKAVSFRPLADGTAALSVEAGAPVSLVTSLVTEALTGAHQLLARMARDENNLVQSASYCELTALSLLVETAAALHESCAAGLKAQGGAS